jgi:anthranilate phosphoribosyltransferase
MELRNLLETAISGKKLPVGDIERLFDMILDGALSSVQLSAFLTAWRCHGEYAELLCSGARSLRSKATKIAGIDQLRPFSDNCGTGGDGQNTFNISTASAIVAASLGARVFKHGNRSVSSKSGSADVLETLGYPVDLSPEATQKLCAMHRLAFLFAPHYHPTMKSIMPTRKELGIPTLFNLLGPLANPTAPDVQLVGVSDKKFLMPMAEALIHLGTKSAAVVHAEDGLDEISVNGKTFICQVKDQEVQQYIFDARQSPWQAERSSMAGGTAKENAEILLSIFANKNSESAKVVALNAGMLLHLVGRSSSIDDGANLSMEALKTGKVQDFFEKWIAAAKSLRASK